MPSISSLQAQLSVMAMDNLTGAKLDGRTKLATASKERQEMRAEIQERKEQAGALQAELADAADQNFFEAAWNWLSGGDGGVGELGDQAASNAAELERIQSELKVLKAETGDVLNGIKDANGQAESAYRASEEMLAQLNRNLKQAI
jgi:hypothetical protein